MTRSLLTFLAYAKQYIKQFPKERSELTYILQVKFINKYKKFNDDVNRELNEKREELEAKYCIKDSSGAFSEREVIAGGQVIFRKNFTVEGEAKKKEEYDKFEDELFERKVSDFEPFYIEIPSSIDISWVKEFTGFIFAPMTAEQEKEWYLNQKEKEVPKK